MDVDERKSSNTIDVANDSGNARKTCSPTRNDAHVLVGVLGRLSLSVSYVIEIGNSLSKS
jgi:hypothetical protein